MPSLVGRLMEAHDEETGERIRGEPLRNEVAVLFMAGHEGNANAPDLDLVLSLHRRLMSEPRCMKNSTRVLGDRLPTLSDLPRLVYTRGAR